jgi:hypothetical protein
LRAFQKKSKRGPETPKRRSWRRSTKRRRPVKFKEGSANNFADLRLEVAGKLYFRAFPILV